MRGRADRGGDLHFGEFGLQSTECGRISARQIEAARIAMTRSVKRGGEIWLRVFPNKPITKKAAETRMGSGKGSPEFWVANIKPGRVLFEISGVTLDVANQALSRAAHKLPVKSRVVVREEA